MSYFHRKFQITKVNRDSVHDLSGVTGIPGCQPTRMNLEWWRRALVLGNRRPTACVQPSLLIYVWIVTANMSFSDCCCVLCHILWFSFSTESVSPLLLTAQPPPPHKLRLPPASRFQMNTLAFLQTRHFIIQPKPEKSEKQAKWDLGKSWYDV